MIIPTRVRRDECRLRNKQAPGTPRALAIVRRHHWSDRNMRLLRRPVARQRCEDDAVLERLRADFDRGEERRGVLRAVRSGLEQEGYSGCEPENEQGGLLGHDRRHARDSALWC